MSTYTLKVHVKIVHQGQKDHKCVQCEKSFSKSGNLRVHVKSVHEKTKDFKCEQCVKSFSSSSTLWHHKKTHGGPRFRCEECSKSYNRKEHLEKHISSVHKEVSNISPERSHQKSSRRHI